MKNLSKKLFLFSLIVSVSAISFGFVQYNSTPTPNKVTICHVPPGNPGNCHEITISTNALQAHLNHGDRIVCNSEASLQVAHKLLGDYNINEGESVNFIVINF